MDVEEKNAAATAAHKGKTYYFCAPACKTTFQKAGKVRRRSKEGLSRRLKG